MTEPLVSIIMPTYNVEQYIAESILSVINQNYQNWELIIINDGSTDTTVQIVEQYTSDKRIVLYHNSCNRGIIYSRNKGLELAKGDYIANLDSDDIATPTRLKKQVDYFSKNPNCVLLGGACIQINSKGRKIGTIERNIPKERLKSLLLFSNFFINSTVMIPAEYAKQICYAEGYMPAEDYDYFTKLANYGEIANLKDSLVFYRVHDNNISTLKKVEQKKAIDKIMINLLNELGLVPDSYELKLHRELVLEDVFLDLDQLRSVENWLLKIARANEKAKKYGDENLKQWCAFFFQRACIKTRQGIKAIRIYKNSELSNYDQNGIKDKLIFLLKNLLKSS